MAKNLRAKIEGLEKKIADMTLEAQELKSKNEKEKESNKIEFQSKELGWQEKEKVLISEHAVKVEELNTKVLVQDKELKDKQMQLDRKELKKLAEAYGDQEKINETDELIWFKRVSTIGSILFVVAILSILITHNSSWVESIKFYIIDVVLFSAVWFCVSQYSNTVKLKNDYANRKVLAQSFSNILNNLSENPDIRNKFIEKTTDVLCAPHAVGEKEPLLTKKVLKDVAEIIATANKV